MLKFLQGDKPDITPAQIKAAFIAGVPIIANLLHVFGVYDLSKEQEDALKQMAELASGFGGVLLLADAHLRSQRGKAAATVQSAALVASAAPTDASVGVTVSAPPIDLTVDLPSDDEEFANPPTQP